MGVVMLPDRPLPRTASPQPIVFGGWLTPSTGAAEQWIGRLGSRMSLTIETPNLKPEPDGRIWTSILLDAAFSGTIIAMPFPQPGFSVGAPGASVVDGAGQAGATLNLRGLTPGYAIRRRQFFSIVHAGRRYLHYASAQAIAGADGKVSVPIGPMLRVSPANGAVVELGRPVIEGRIAGESRGWTMARARTQGLTFTIAEVA